MMMHAYNKLGLLLAFLFFQFSTFAQRAYNPWEDKIEVLFEKNKTDRQIIPVEYRTLHLDIEELQVALKQAPPRFSALARQNPTLLTLPMPDGTMQQFSITEASIMHPDLQARYPDIRSYAGKGIDDPSATIRFDLTPKGFHAMVLTAETSAVFIDPYAKDDKEHYISYYKKDFANHLGKTFTCHAHHDPIHVEALSNTNLRAAGDCQLRDFELALACTGEYANFHGGTVNSVMAAFNTTMTRVNGLFERDASLTMTLVANTDDLIFLNGASDPYTNNSGGQMLGQNQTTCDNIIGSNNYDIGHVFSTGGGGIASLQSPCNNNQKARGVTGLPQPIGDPFDVDYVAHEMGHQYGATHTFNNSCGGNRTGATAYEPGSAATIMGYAGICPPNIQNNSDAYFHTASVVQMGNFVSNTSCADVINTNNNPPTINAGANYTIPRSTPFELIAEAEDHDGDFLTYCWEQFDNETATMPPLPSNVEGPLFRSFDPTNFPNRVFPRLSDLVNNNSNQWEVLPGVGRDMNFQCTVRDNNTMYGCTDEDRMMITVDGNSGPFEVMYPNTNGITWTIGETETVTWDVANTDQSPVNASNVDISLSFDGGYNYPVVLASGVPNTGSYTLTVPNFEGNENRIRIQGSGNIFFDISNEDFTIEAPEVPTFIMAATPNSQNACTISESVAYELSLTGTAGFDEAVNFDVTGLPTDVIAQFNPNPLMPDGMTTMTLSNFANAEEGTYELIIEANSPSQMVITMVELIITSGIPDVPTLVSVENGATGIDFVPEFIWNTADGATEYTLELANNPMFGDSTFFSGTVTDTTVTIQGFLPGSVYYWHIIASNSCGDAVSETFSFQTISEFCLNYEATEDDLPFTINDNSSTDYTINVPDDFAITDVNIGVVIGHTWMGDIAVEVTSPNNTSVMLFDRPGVPASQWGCDGDNLSVFFDDAAELTAIQLENTCDENTDENIFTIEGEYQPLENLSAFNDEMSSGDWVFNFSDAVQQDQGGVFALALQLCSELPTSTLTITDAPLTVPQGMSAPIENANLSSASSSEMDEITYLVTSIPTNGALLLNGMPLLVGGTFTQSDIDSGALTYQHDNSATTMDSFLYDTFDETTGWVSNNTFDIIILMNTLNANTILDSGIDCNNNNNGQLSVNTSGGTMPYEYSLDGNTFQMSNVFEDLSAGTYTVTIRDANGFTFTTNSVNVSNPTALTASATVDEDIITVTASGGTGSLMYSIDGMNFQASNAFGGLSNGDYTITIQDENACTTTVSANVSVNTLAVSANADSEVSCNGANDGSLTVNVSGGTMPFQYSIDGGTSFQMSSTFTNLAPGTYEILVQDADGFTRTTNTVTITEPAGINTTSSVDEDLITVTASGGTGSLLYSIDGVNFQASNVFSGVANGSYTITVQDENGCTETSTAIVAVNSLVVSATLVNDITCTNADNGSIEVNVGGGEGPYMFSINGGAFQANNIFNNLSAGTYTIEVQDAQGFFASTNTVTVTNPDMISVSASADENVITVTASGGTGNLSYSLNDGAPQSSNIFSGLANGDYTILVVDQNGCMASTMASIAVNTLSVSATLVNDISCNNANDGTISVSVAGGMPPLMYSLDGENFQPDNTFTNLSAGTYTVTVRDADGFTMMANAVILNNPTVLNLTASVNENQLTANASGGTGNLMYSINGGPFQNNNTFDNLANGDYTVSVQDENGCTASDLATVFVNTLSVSASVVNTISCNDANDGTISVNVASGTPPYMYSLDGENFQMNNTFNNLAAGTYTVTVRDSEGLVMETNPLSLNNPDALNVSATIDENEITVTADGGTGSLMYSIDGVSFQASNMFGDVANGDYIITVQDENGCTETTTATIAVNTLMVFVEVSNITCFGVIEDGSILVDVSGGTAPFEYSLDGENFQPSNTFNSLSAGTYVVTIRDSEGFMITTNPIDISSPDALDLSLAVDGDEITATTSGGTGNYTYSINGGAPQGNNVFSNLPNGDYEIVVTDENGCTTSALATINVIQPLIIVASFNTNITCHNADDGIISVQMSGGVPPYMYSLDGENFQADNTFSNLTAGIYTVMVQDAVGEETSTGDLLITNPDPIDFTVGLDNTTITISAVSGGTGAYLYSIDGGVTTQASGIFDNLGSADYTVGVLDENGCSSFELVTVTSIYEVSSLAFELFPNPSEGFFQIRLSDALVTENIQIELFDVLGQKVHQSAFTGIQKAIDVRHLAAGTYQLKIITENDFGTKSIVITK